MCYGKMWVTSCPETLRLWPKPGRNQIFQNRFNIFEDHVYFFCTKNLLTILVFELRIVIDCRCHFNDPQWDPFVQRCFPRRYMYIVVCVCSRHLKRLIVGDGPRAFGVCHLRSHIGASASRCIYMFFLTTCIYIQALKYVLRLPVSSIILGG